MEELNSVWQIGVIALLLGALIGILAYRLLTPSARETDKIKSELEAARGELERYRESVNRHFDKTSELVNDLTQDYVRVYQHLAEGAQTLGDGKTFSNRLEHHPGKVSIALEDPREIAGEAVVDAAPAAAESIDEHAAPFSSAPAANDSAAESDTPAAGNQSAAGKADREQPASADTGIDATADTREPVLDVEALDEAREKPAGDIGKTAELGPEPGTTRH